MPLKIGITGGIGSGKTTVARIFEVLGIPVYYADDAAKRTVTGFLVAERCCAAIRPGEFLRAVVGGIHDDCIILEAKFLELIEQ